MKALILLLLATGVNASLIAQSTPPAPAQPVSPPNQHTSPTQPTQQQPQTTEWAPMQMNDSLGIVLRLHKDQLDGWKERSERYDRDYRALKQGTNYDRDRQAWMDRRDRDLQGFLAPDQYERWNSMNNTNLAYRTKGIPTAPAPTTQPAR